MKKIGLVLCLGLSALSMSPDAVAEKRYVGGDISLLPEYEAAGSIYKDENGKPIADLITFSKDEGMNAMRVRVFVNPQDYDGADKDPNACQDINYIIPLCQRIKNAGMSLIVDFMYSDTWADPAKQWTPKQWEGLDDAQLCEAVYTYTKDCLEKLKAAGATPDFIQTGNEISYGMLWGAHDAPASDLKKVMMGSVQNWERFGQLLTSAGQACREECPDARIIIHTERVPNVNVQRNFYRQMASLNIDYDIIGISYYPYFHGSLNVLNNALYELTTDFDKPIMMVETGYPYKYEIPGTTQKVDYPYTAAGQNQYAEDLVTLLRKYDKVEGLFWWWMEYNPYGPNLEGWYNAPLVNATTGKILPAFKTLISFADDDSGVGTIGAGGEKSEVRYYDMLGNPVRDVRQFRGLMIGTDGTKLIQL